MKSMILFLLVAFIFTGCASTGRKIDQSAVAKIEKGITTQQEVISLLGSPDNITRMGTGDTVFAYSYARVAAKPSTFIPILGPFVGGANIQHQMFMVTFDSNGVVKDFISSQSATESDVGVATGSKPSVSEVEYGKRPK